MRNLAKTAGGGKSPEREPSGERKRAEKNMWGKQTVRKGIRRRSTGCPQAAALLVCLFFISCAVCRAAAPSAAASGMSGVTDETPDQTGGTSDVTAETSDATDGTSDVTAETSDAMGGTSDVTDETPDLTGGTSDASAGTAALKDSGIDYTEEVRTLENPDCGYTKTIWYVCKPGDTPVYSPDENLVLMFVDIGAFSSGINGSEDLPLDDSFFTGIRATLANCRANGCTVALRFRYDASGTENPEPATFDFLLSHIAQIRENGFLDDYQDIIAFVESGFVGKWGEQHGGKYVTADYKARVLDAMLDCVPSPIPVTVRTPDTFARWAGISRSDLASYRCEAGSEASRVGLYNDGYMGSDTDLGTFSDRAGETAWLGNQTLTSVYGGEFSGDLSWAQKYTTYLPENAIPEMYTTHLSYINANIWTLYKNYTFSSAYDFSGGETDSQSPDSEGDAETAAEGVSGTVDHSAYYGQTVWQFIRDHLGYRFVIRESRLSETVPQGGSLELAFSVENTGFANPYRPQRAEIILEKDGDYIRTDVDADTSAWRSLAVSAEDLTIKIPGGLPRGKWNAYLKLSVGNNTLAQTGLRSVRFANANIWNSTLGANYLGSFEVTDAACDADRIDGTFYQTNASDGFYAGDAGTGTGDGASKSDGTVYTTNGITSIEQYAEGTLAAEDGDRRLYLMCDESDLFVTAVIPEDAAGPCCNLQVRVSGVSQAYWLYYQSNGFVYYSGGTPDGITMKHEGDVIQFKIPFGDVMNLSPGTVLDSVKVFVQDDSVTGWPVQGTISSGTYTIPEYFSVYSGTAHCVLARGSEKKLTVKTLAEGLSYQWYFNGDAIEGATEADYTLTASESGTFSVEMTTAAGTKKTTDICVAEVIDISAAPEPTETPTPEPTAAPVLTETPTPEPTAAPVLTETPTPEPTAAPVPTNTPTGTPVPELTEKPESAPRYEDIDPDAGAVL